MEKQIKAISPTGIDYLDDLGHPQFIDFQDCHKRWLATDAQDYPDSAEYIRETNEEYKCIGQRLLYGEKENGRPYIEFFTEPMIRFEFSSRHEGFDEIIYKLRKFGWLTSDLG